MRYFFFFMLFANSFLKANNYYVPEQFKDGKPIEQIILIFDVDGVVRNSTDGVADPRVIDAVKSLLEYGNVDVTFISGTAIENDINLQKWRRGNIPLNQVFGDHFSKEIKNNQVTIFGVLGGHRMNENGELVIVDEYPPEIALELGKLLLHGFLKEVIEHGSGSQKIIAKNLQNELDNLILTEYNLSHETHPDFIKIIDPILIHLDPKFRLISNGALIETHTSNPPWKTKLSSQWLIEQLKDSKNLISNLPISQKHIATGYGHRGEGGFNYLLISKTNKGITTHHHIQEKLKSFPNALIVTIGDSQVDFPMHKNAHIAFHVGPEDVWQNHYEHNIIMVRNENGEDKQHLEGTLKVLELIKDSIGKSFYDLKYIPKTDSENVWGYYSLRDVQYPLLNNTNQ